MKAKKPISDQTSNQTLENKRVQHKAVCGTKKNLDLCISNVAWHCLACVRVEDNRGYKVTIKNIVRMTHKNYFLALPLVYMERLGLGYHQVESLPSPLCLIR